MRCTSFKRRKPSTLRLSTTRLSWRFVLENTKSFISVLGPFSAAAKKNKFNKDRRNDSQIINGSFY